MFDFLLSLTDAEFVNLESAIIRATFAREFRKREEAIRTDVQSIIDSWE